MAIYGESYTVEYLEMVMSMKNLLKMNHKYRISRIFLDTRENYISFKFEKV